MPSPSEDTGETEQSNVNNCTYQGVPDLESLGGDGSRDETAGAPLDRGETRDAPLSGEDQGESPEEEDDVEEEEDEDTEGEGKGEYPSFVQLPQDMSHSTAQCNATEEVTHTSNGHYVPNVPHPAPLHHQHHQLTAGVHSRGALYSSESPPQVHSLMLGGAIHHGANAAYVIAPTAEHEYQHLHHASHQHLHHHHQQHQHHQNQVFMTGDNSGNNSNKEKMKPKRKRVISCEQRKAANIRERRRMTSLNDAFDILRKTVPTFHYEKKLSRIETLKLAIQYIYFMTEVLNGKDPKHVSMTPRLPMFQGMLGNMMDPGRPGRRGRRRKDQNHLLMHHTYPFLT